MDNNLVKEFNKAIVKELESAYHYEAMAAWLYHHKLQGMAQALRKQALEEIEHAHKFRDYLELRGVMVEYDVVNKPKFNYKSVLEIFEDALSVERAISQSILHMRSSAAKLGEEGAVIFLDQFVVEQEQEEHHARRALDRLHLAGVTHETTQGAALYLLDKEFGSV